MNSSFSGTLERSSFPAGLGTVALLAFVALGSADQKNTVALLAFVMLGSGGGGCVG